MTETAAVLVILAWVVSIGVAIAINVALSMWFSKMAAEKGYDNWYYFWICFLFGVIGYAIVAAKPNANTERRIDKLERFVEREREQRKA